MMKKLSLVACIMLCLAFDAVKDERLLGTWKLMELTELGEVEKIEVPIKLVLSQEGKTGKFTGNTSKNLFSGLFDIKKKREITISGLMSTHMGDDKQSKRFLSKLPLVSRYSLNESNLTLESSDQNISLKFERYSP